MLDKPHFTNFYRIYFKDTDTGGVVYHARFIEILEMGRSDFFRELNYSIKNILDEEGFAFPVYDLKVKYLAPAFLEDLLTLELRLDEVRGAKMFFRYLLRNQHGKEVLDASTINVLVNIKNSWRPVSVLKFFPRLVEDLPHLLKS